MSAHLKKIVSAFVGVVFAAFILLCCCSLATSKAHSFFSNVQEIKHLSACCQPKAQHNQNKCECHNNLSLETSKSFEWSGFTVKALHFSKDTFSVCFHWADFASRSIVITQNHQPPPETLQNLTPVYLQKSILRL